MVRQPETIAFQHTLGFSLTERCNLRCKHCLVAASSEGADMALSDLLRWIKEAAEVDRVKLLSMTGGEPFLVYDVLQEAVAYAASLGLQTSVVTNGYWANTPAHAAHTLRGVSSLSSLVISFDRFHRQFIPVQTIKTAILAAREVGIKATVRVSYLNDEHVEVTEAARQLEGVVDLADINSQPIIWAGRAVHELAREQLPCIGNDSLCMSASKPVVMPDGKVYACCAPPTDLRESNPLLLGNANEHPLSAVLEDSQYNVPLHLIRTQGPYGLWSLVRGQEEDLQRYDTASMCSLCRSLMLDPEFLHDLERAVEDPKVWRKIALERFYLLGELAMLTGLGGRVEV